jgi:hypothetical protein
VLRRIFVILCVLSVLLLTAIVVLPAQTQLPGAAKFIEGFTNDHPTVLFVFAWGTILSACGLILWRFVQFWIQFAGGWNEAQTQPRGFEVGPKQGPADSTDAGPCRLSGTDSPKEAASQE